VILFDVGVDCPLNGAICQTDERLGAAVHIRSPHSQSTFALHHEATGRLLQENTHSFNPELDDIHSPCGLRL
jgi:hypothetical protein